MRKVSFTINGQPVTGVQSELHFMNWCLSLENERQPVPHTGLQACAVWQRGVYGTDAAARALVEQSGCIVTVRES